MTITGLDYFFDLQQKRYLEQVIRAFSGFKYQTGWLNGVQPQLLMVPCRAASRDKLTSTIIKNNSENTLLTVPMITVDQTGLTFRKDALQSPTHVDTRVYMERKIDPATGQYTSQQGNSYTVERLMPLPFQMNFQVDIWTSNRSQKDQLLEQILTIICPQFEIQNSTSPLDWSAKTWVTVEDITYTSQAVPVGSTGENIEIATILLTLPMWLNPPAKVTQMHRIEQIVANINVGSSYIDEDGDDLEQIIITPGNYRIQVSNGSIMLLGHDASGNNSSWTKLLQEYGAFRPTQSTLSLTLATQIDTGVPIVGTLQQDVNNDNILFWQIDPTTLPANTLSPITAVIDPLRVWPNGPGGLQWPPVNGTRYLLVSDIGSISKTTEAWGSLVAKEDDIIEYQSSAWTVSFKAATATGIQYVLNNLTSTQLRWSVYSGWVLAIDGEYPPGYWRLAL